MTRLNKASEEYRKYLTQIRIGSHGYFSVFGSDLEDDYMDKFLIDENNYILLFSNVEKLKEHLLKSNHVDYPKMVNNFIDIQNARDWANFLTKNAKPYTALDLDLLASMNLTSDKELFAKESFITLGLINDYGLQTSSKGLVSLLRKNEILHFMDICADIYLWKSNDSSLKDLSVSEINWSSLILKIAKIVTLFKTRIHIVD